MSQIEQLRLHQPFFTPDTGSSSGERRYSNQALDQLQRVLTKIHGTTVPEDLAVAVQGIAEDYSVLQREVEFLSSFVDGRKLLMGEPTLTTSNGWNATYLPTDHNRDFQTLGSNRVSTWGPLHIPTIGETKQPKIKAAGPRHDTDIRLFTLPSSNPHPAEIIILGEKGSVDARYVLQVPLADSYGLDTRAVVFSNQTLAVTHHVRITRQGKEALLVELVNPVERNAPGFPHS